MDWILCFKLCFVNAILGFVWILSVLSLWYVTQRLLFVEVC